MTNLSGQTIGIVGLGLMGRPMGRNLMAAGARLVVHNRSPGPVGDMAAEGAVPADSPRAVAEEAETVIVMVADTAAVEAVLSGADGVVAGVRPNTLVIDMGTTAFTATQEFARRVADAGGDYVDAPVSGGTVGAEAGALTIMAGGTEAAFARAG
ncbi:MAG: NAD(P)-binding domain-containing protein, partial [Proteobacteria bacterium]|nr:NAD(P)-binding domain-containing protein [Pseudomonadota bacterium]